MTNSYTALGASIVLTGRLFVNKVNSHFQASGINITIEQMEIMFQILNHSGKRIILNELSCLLHKNKSTILRSIDILEKKKYVSRHAVSGDRRKNILEVTHEGTLITEKAFKEFGKVKIKYIGTIEESQLETCSKVLETIRERCNSIK